MSRENHIILNDFNLFHLISNKLSIEEFKKSYLTLFKDIAYKFTIAPSDSDYTVFRSIENTVDPIIPIFNKLIESNFQNFIEFSNQNKQILLLIYGLRSIISIIFISVEFYFFIKNFENIFIRYNIVFNYLRIFNSSVKKKINIILEIFNDFTEEGLNEMKKNNKLLKTQFSIDKGNPFFEKLKHQNDLKIKQMKMNEFKNGLNSTFSVNLLNANGELSNLLRKNSSQQGSLDEKNKILSSGNGKIIKSLSPKSQKQINSKISNGFFSVLQIYKLKNILMNKKYKKEKDENDEVLNCNYNTNTNSSLVKKVSLKPKKVKFTPKKKFKKCEPNDPEVSFSNLDNINKLTNNVDENKEKDREKIF